MNEAKKEIPLRLPYPEYSFWEDARQKMIPRPSMNAFIRMMVAKGIGKTVKLSEKEMLGVD